jgi:hypothetical protein
MSRRSRASDRHLTLLLGRAVHGDETAAGTRRGGAPVEGLASFHSIRRTAVYVIRTHGGVTGKAGDRLPMSIRQTRETERGRA